MDSATRDLNELCDALRDCVHVEDSTVTLLAEDCWLSGTTANAVHTMFRRAAAESGTRRGNKLPAVLVQDTNRVAAGEGLICAATAAVALPRLWDLPDALATLRNHGVSAAYLQIFVLPGVHATLDAVISHHRTYGTEAERLLAQAYLALPPQAGPVSPAADETTAARLEEVAEALIRFTCNVGFARVVLPAVAAPTTRRERNRTDVWSRRPGQVR